MSRGPTERTVDGLSWKAWLGHPLSSTRRPQRGNDQFQFELGLYRFGKREYQRAAEAFLTILTDFEQSPLKERALYWLAESYGGSGEWDEAEKTYRILLREKPPRGVRERVLLELAEISRRKGNLEDALRYYRAFLDESPDSDTAPLVAVRLGEVFSLLGRFAAAAEQFRKVAADQRNTGTPGIAVFKWAEALRHEGACAEAVARYDDYLERNPAGRYEEAAHYGKAWCLLTEGRAEEAGDVFSLIVEASPESLFADEAALMAGWTYRLAGRPAASDRALARLHDDFEASPWRDRGLFLLALNAYDRSDFAEARLRFREAQDTRNEGETFVRCRFMEGATLMGLGLFSEAFPLFAGLLEGQEGEVVLSALPWAAAAGVRAGRTRETEELLLRVAKDGETRETAAEAWYWVGALRLEEGRHTGASLALGKTVDMLPPGASRDRALLLLGEVYFDQKNMREAEGRFRMILEGRAESEYSRQARVRLAEVLSRQGKEVEPTSIFRDVLEDERAEEADRARFGLGMLYFREEEYGRAAQEFRTLLAKSPGSRFADDAGLMLAMTSYRSESFSRAVNELQGFLERFPGSELVPEALLRMADALYRLRRLDEAQESYGEVLLRFEGTKHAAVAEYGLVLLAQARGDLDEYVALTRAYVGKYPADGLARTALAQAVRQLLLHRRYAEGGEMLRRLLRDFPGDSSSADVVVVAALADRSADSRRETADRLRLEIRASSDCREKAPVRYSLSNLQLERGGCEAAVRELEALVEECPRHALAPFALFDSAGCHLKRGDRHGAAESYRAITRGYPGSPLMPGALYLLGVLTLELGEYGDAVDLFTQMLPGSGSALDGAAAFHLGRALQGLGRAREAYEQYRRSRSISPEGEFAQRSTFRAAEIARSAGWREEAATLYRAVIAGGGEVLAELAREGLSEVEEGAGEEE